MDAELVSEIEKIMKTENLENGRKGAARLLQYMLTIPKIPDMHMLMLQHFINYAFSILPSSSLPILISQRFDLSVNRTRKVSFGKTEIHEVNSRHHCSGEAEKQRTREDSALSLTNTDPFKKFRPKNCIEKGLPFITKKVPLHNLNFRNRWDGEPSISNRGIPRIALKIDDIIAHPEVLDVFR